MSALRRTLVGMGNHWQMERLVREYQRDARTAADARTAPPARAATHGPAHGDSWNVKIFSGLILPPTGFSACSHASKAVPCFGR